MLPILNSRPIWGNIAISNVGVAASIFDGTTIDPVVTGMPSLESPLTAGPIYFTDDVLNAGGYSNNGIIDLTPSGLYAQKAAWNTSPVPMWSSTLENLINFEAYYGISSEDMYKEYRTNELYGRGIGQKQLTDWLNSYTLYSY